MGVSSKTISRWENGRQKMGTVAECPLRMVVHQYLQPDTATALEEVFPKLKDNQRVPPDPVRISSSSSGWEKAA